MSEVDLPGFVGERRATGGQGRGGRPRGGWPCAVLLGVLGVSVAPGWAGGAGEAGSEASVEARSAPGGGERTGELPLIPPEVGLDAAQILKRAVAWYPDMHAGRVGETLRGPLLVAYTRTVRTPGPLTVQHLLYTWPPERARLELKVLEGGGRDSISLLTGAGAWLLVDGQRVEVNRKELQVRIGEYGLQSLLKLHLELPDQVATHFGADQATYEGRLLDPTGRQLHIIGLRGAEDRARILRVGIDAESYMLRRAWYRTSSGMHEYAYEDFRVVLPPLSLPFRIELIRNGSVEDTIELKRVEVLAVPAEPFLDVGAVRPPARRGLINAAPP